MDYDQNDQTDRRAAVIRLRSFMSFDSRRERTKQCAATTAAGRPCRKRARSHSPFCPWHEPMWRPAECIGGPWDGRTLTLREAQSRVVLAVRRPGGPLVLERCSHRPAGIVVGQYWLRYQWLVPVWSWERLSEPGAVIP